MSNTFRLSGNPVLAAVKRLSFAGALAGTCVLASPGIARADDNCPPGSWFCGETQPPPAASGKDLQPLPADGSTSTKAETKADAKPVAATPPPPVVVYQPPPSTVVVQTREAPPPYYYVPRQAPARKREWGLNLHLGGLMMGDGRDGNTGMAVVGLGLRFRPVPAFAIEGDLDFAGGRDYNGFRRSETGFTFNGIVFLNPKSKTQVYLVGGFGWSGARAVDDRSGYNETEYRYDYFGVQGGGGLEFRLSRTVALNVDVRGIVRGRVDDDRHTHPEFVDGNGRSTNTSGAGVIQGGLTFYW